MIRCPRAKGFADPEFAVGGRRRLVVRSILLCALAAIFASASGVAQVSYTIAPTRAQFAKTTIGMYSHTTTFTLTNTGTSDFTVTSITLTPSQFHLDTGWAPVKVSAGKRTAFGVYFVPDGTQTFNGQLTINIGNTTQVVLPLRGTGQTTGALVNLSTSLLTFPGQPMGTTSVGQSVTVSNVGTSPLTLQSINIDAPFVLQGFTAPATLQPGDSLPLTVTFSPFAIGTFTNALVFTYDVLPPNGVSLTGTGIAPTSFVVGNFSILPGATVSSAYLANLNAASGTPPYSWALTSGSSLPLGLSLSSAGTISGTLDPSIGAGNYGMTVQAIDSSVPPLVTTAYLTIPVGVSSGASCNNISWNVAGSSDPMVALTDLGFGTYLGSQGGLYPAGSNVRPPSNDAAGLAIAQGIQPLDANGNVDLVNGKMGLISIGESNTSNTFAQFTINANADPAKNPQVVIVKGAQPSAEALKFADSTDGVWNAIFQFFLPQVGLTANQVVAAWVQAVNAFPNGTFPGDMAKEQSQLENIARNLHTKFPNLKLAYFTSKFYDGYDNGLPVQRYPEPYAYETGFAVKWSIQDQIMGLSSLNYDSGSGPVKAPWMTWGPYEWSNGLLGRSDGLVWSCQDVTSDGVHPIKPWGWEKDANILLNFFKSEETATPWFLAPSDRSHGGKSTTKPQRQLTTKHKN